MPTLWLDTHMSEDAAGAGGQFIKQLTAEFLVGTLRSSRMTLLRTIVGLDLGMAVRDAGEGDAALDIGIGITAPENITNVPDPNVSTDHPTRGWIWRARYRVYGVAVDDQNVRTTRIDLDLRSRRKLDNGFCYCVGVNTDNQGVSQPIKVMGLIRQLWLVG